jgi:hypothetical protein
MFFISERITFLTGIRHRRARCGTPQHESDDSFATNDAAASPQQFAGSIDAACIEARETTKSFRPADGFPIVNHLRLSLGRS